MRNPETEPPELAPHRRGWYNSGQSIRWEKEGNALGPCGFFWDLDGTLVDSYPAIVPVAKELCDELGLGGTVQK